jgi:hypothetical protein
MDSGRLQARKPVLVYEALARYAVLVADLLAFTKAVFRHWIAGMTGGILAAGLSITGIFHPLPKNIITAALIGYVIVAAFYAWREEHKKAQDREDARHRAMIACFQRSVDIIEKENRMPFNALVSANAYELETANEVMGVCVLMETYGHGDPFTEIDKVISDDKRLAFLKFFRWSPQYDRNNEIAYLEAALDWANRFGVEIASETRLKLLIRKILPWG